MHRTALAAGVAVQVPPLTAKSAALGPLMFGLTETALVCLLEALTTFMTLLPNFVLPIEKLKRQNGHVDGAGATERDVSRGWSRYFRRPPASRHARSA